MSQLPESSRGRTARATPAAAFAAVFVAFVESATVFAAGGVAPVDLHGRTMGTTYNIRYWTRDGCPPSSAVVQRSIDDLLATFDQQMSTWRPDSELSRFNAAPANEWFAVSTDVAIVTSRALKLHKLTDGALDVTVIPLSTLWGFGPNVDRQRIHNLAPTDAEIATALSHVGSQHLHARLEPPALRKDLAELEIDLACIASGYAVDLIVESLGTLGIDNAFVEIGGEVRALGTRTDGKPWRVGVQSPSPNANAIATAIPLTNSGLATSGDFHNTRTIDGITYTHIIDPRSGRPLRHRGVSITIVAETAFAADGIATALCLMDGRVAFEWCEEHDIAALFQARSDRGGAAIRATPAFDKLMATPVQGTTAE